VVPAFVNNLAAVVIRHRIATLLVVALLVSLMASRLPSLKADFTPQDLFTTHDEQRDAADRFKAQFGHTENVLIILVQAPDVLDRAVLQYIHDVSTAIAARDYCERVESITVTPMSRAGGPGVIEVGPLVVGDTVSDEDIARLRSVLSDAPLVEGQLLGSSHRVAAIAMFLDREQAVRIEPVRSALEGVDALLEARPPPAGVTISRAGLPHIRAYVTESFLEDQLIIIPLALLASLLIQLIALRWLPGVILPSLAVILATLVAVGGMAAIGEPVNIINQVVPILIIIIGMSDSIHLISRFREESQRASPEQAARQTLASMAVACFLTSLTTAVGFGSLAVSGTEILRRFGITAAIGVLIAYVITVAVLPPLLSWTKPKVGALRTPADGLLERALVRLTAAIVRRPGVFIAGGVGVFAACCAIATQINVDTFLMETFREGDPIYETNQLVEAELDGVLPIELAMFSSTPNRFNDPAIANAVHDVREWLLAQDGVLSATSYVDLLHEARVAYHDDPERRLQPLRSVAEIAQLRELLTGANPNPLDPFLTRDGQQARLGMQIADIGAQRVIPLTQEAERRLREALGNPEDIEVFATGDAFVGSAGLDSLIRDMIGSLMLAFVFIFGFMTVSLRSVKLGLLSAPPNAIPLAITAAWMTVTGVALNTTTVVIFTISLGLAVDDTIHILARFQEERRAGASIDVALERTMRGAGRAIVVTSAILIAGLMVLSLSTFVPIMQFGTLLSITVLACLFGDLLLLPALLKVAYREAPGELVNRG